MAKQNELFRAFFAVDLDETTLSHVISVINKLKQSEQLHHVRWTRPENLHITMRFLANISPIQFEDIVKSVGLNVCDLEPFEVELNMLKLFPSPHRPHCIVLMPEIIAPLLKLNQCIEHGLEGCDVQRERRAFVPHLTIGRIKSEHKLILDQIELPKLKFTVNNIQLFRSDPDEHTSVYTPLVCIPLRN